MTDKKGVESERRGNGMQARPQGSEADDSQASSCVVTCYPKPILPPAPLRSSPLKTVFVRPKDFLKMDDLTDDELALVIEEANEEAANRHMRDAEAFV